MRIEFVDVAQLFAANVALPGITFAVAALVQEIQCFVGELNAAKQARQDLFTI